MKNLKILLVLFFCCTVHGYGQSITFTFLGKNIQGDKTINVDRVYLFNETNGSDTLVIGNTFSVLISSADIFDQANMNKITSYPNPFKKQVNISFYSSFYERAQVEVYTIDGKKIAGWNSFINTGENNLLLKSGVEGILLVSIHSKNIRLSTKLICTEKSLHTELAGFTNSSDIPYTYRHKSATIWDGAFEYRLGDSLSLKGYSNNMVSEIIHDVPFGNKEYTFLFEIMDEAPKADFIINARSVNQGEVINFTDLSSNLPTEWHWDFGDGGSSDLQNPEYYYNSKGLYTVTLITSNQFGADTLTRENYIEVKESYPIADFTASKTTINQGEVIRFTDLSSNAPTKWNWDFGDGNTSDNQNPDHVYTSTGLYTVTLIAGNQFASDTLIRVNYIEVNTSEPVADFTANTKSIIQGEEVKFTDLSSNSPTEWNWDFGDGVTSELQNPTHIYNTTGFYTVTLLVRNQFGSSTFTRVRYIEVSSSFPLADFTANKTSIKQGEEIGFKDLSSNMPIKWHWDFGDGDISDLQNPGHVYNSPGFYTVTLIVSNQFASDTIARVNYVEVTKSIPVADFTANNKVINQGGEISFTDLSSNSPIEWHWDFGDGGISDLQNPGHIYLSTGFYTVTLIVSNQFASDTLRRVNYIEVNKSKPIAEFTADNQTINQGEEIGFTDNSLNSPSEWYWEFGDGFSSNEQNPSHVYNLIGNYTVTLVVSNQFGSDTISRLNYIEVNTSEPVADMAASPKVIQQGDTISFTDRSLNTPTSWYWEFGDGDNSVEQNPGHVYNLVGDYTVTLVVSNQFGADTLTRVNFIEVNSSKPVTEFTASSKVIKQGETITFSDLSSNSPTAWHWDFGDGYTSDLQNPEHTFNSSGLFTVTLIASNQFASDTLERVDYIEVSSSKPVAVFIADKTTVNQGKEISFTDKSTNSPTGWYWEFGDGDNSVEQNPSHVYNLVGNYTVTLVVSNQFGSDTISILNYIEVNTSKPIADFIADKTAINQGKVISFTDLSSNSPTEWYWDFGDGGTSELQNPNHTFNSSGSFTVTLIASNQFGSDTLTRVNYIEVNTSKPLADFKSDKMTIKQGETITFTDLSSNSPTSWHWNFGDGSTSDLQNPDHSFNLPGLYSITFIASNQFGSDTITKLDYIEVTALKPLADFTADKTIIKQGERITFTDLSSNSPTSWLWNFGDGGTSELRNPNHSYVISGVFTVTLIASTQFASDTISRMNYIEVKSSKPIADFTADKVTIKQGETITFSDLSSNSPTVWHWDFGDGGISELQNPDHTFNSSGLFTVTLIASNQFAADTLTRLKYINVSSSKPLAYFTASKTTIKQGETITFTDLSSNSPTSWLWDFGDGETSELQNPDHTFNSSGLYTVILIASNQFASDTLTRLNYIEVSSSKPIADFTASQTTIKQGETITFSDLSSNSPTSWHWDFGDGGTSELQNPDHTFNSSGSFSVTLIASNQFASDTLTRLNYIEVISSKPIAYFTASKTTIKQGETITFSDLSSNSPTSWHWDFGDGAASEIQNPDHTFNSSGSFTITLIASNQFASDTLTRLNYIGVSSSKPIADFTASKTIIKQGETITFTDLSSNSPTAWHWDFGDGGTSELQNPGHTFNSSGLFTVILIANNQFASDTLTRVNYINVKSSKPIADFTASKTTIKQGETITFTDLSSNSPTSWHWDFGDGGTSEIQNPGHTFNSSGLFTVTLIASNQFASDTLTRLSYIDVSSSKPIADFTASKTTIKQGETITFSDLSSNSPTAWHWDFGDGGTSELQNPGHTFNSSGLFTVTLIASNQFASDTLTRMNYIKVKSSKPIAEFSASKTTLNQGETIMFTDLSSNSPTTWHWDFGDGGTSELQNPDHTFGSSGIFTVSLIISNQFGTDTLRKVNYIDVESSKPIAEFSASDTMIHEGETITFTDLSLNSPTSWHWDFGDGGTSDLQNPNHTYNILGVYTVSLIADNQFGSDTIIKSNIIDVLAAPEPILSITPDTSTFAFDTTTTQITLNINNSGVDTLTWSISEDIEWLTVNNTSGETTTEADPIIVSVSRDGLSPGSYSGTILISSNGGNKNLTVTMEVLETISPQQTPKKPGWQ